MSQANYQPVQPGDPRTAAPVNTIYTALGNASANLTAVNFAGGGLDQRALEAHPVGNRTGLVSSSTRNAATLALSGFFAQYVQNGTAFRLNAPGALPAALLAGELLRIRGRVWLGTTVAAGVGLGSIAGPIAVFGLRIAWNNGATVGIAHSNRQVYRGTLAANRGLDANIFVEGWLKGPIALINWAELQYTFAGAGCVAFPTASMLWATLFRRQNEV